MFKQGNEERDVKIAGIVERRNITGYDRTWQDVSDELFNETGIKETPNTCRKAYKRYCEKQKEKLIKQVNHIGVYDVSGVCGGGDGGQKLENPKPKQFSSVEIKSDGTQISERRIAMSETDSKSPEFCLAAHGFDPKLWEVVSVKNNFWDSNDSENGITTLYQSKLIVKPKGSKELTLEDVENVVAKINSDLLKDRIKFNVKVVNGKKLLEVDIADLHVGSLSWHEQVEKDNDYKIAFGNLVKVVKKLEDILNTGEYEKLELCFLGDFVHVDTNSLTTSGGTQVDTDSRPEKMIMKAYEMVMYIIDNLCCVPTEVKWVGGNHSKLVEFAIFQALPKIYAHAKHITFDVSPMDRKVLTYGKVLVGLLHGDEISKEERNLWLQRDFRKEWANAEYVEIHCGHFHQEQLFKDIGGIVHRTNPTLKVIDKYEYDHGWNSTKVILAYSWDKENGLDKVYYLK